MHLGRHESVANVWSSRLLAGVAVLAVVHLLSGVTWAESLAQLMLTGFLMLGWPRFSFMARMLALACVVASFFALWRLPSPWAVLHEAAGGFVFLAAFMTALAVLRLPCVHLGE